MQQFETPLLIMTVLAMSMMKLLRSLLLAVSSCSLAAATASTCSPTCACALCLLPRPQNACRCAKLPNLFHLRCKYNCGYVHVHGDGDGDGEGSATPFAYFTALFCSSSRCFCCCCLFPFAGILLLKMFRWIVEREICLPDAVRCCRCRCCSCF